MSAPRASRSSIVPPSTPRAHLTYWALLAGCVIVAAAASPAFNKPSPTEPTVPVQGGAAAH